MSRINCPKCATTQEIGGGLLWTRCGGCRGLLFQGSGGPAVVVGHQSELIAQQIGLALSESGFCPVSYSTGEAVLDAARRMEAPAAVLDVALEEPRSFEVIERLREGQNRAAVVLVASVFNRTAYKRRPQSLYGADDYVEQHHIPDMLPAKVSRLLGLPEPAAPPWDDEVQEHIRRGEMRGELAGAARAQALARSIVADIALYHESEIGRHLRGLDDVVVVAALGEGRRMLGEVLRGVEVEGDPIGAAFGELMTDLRSKG